MVVGGAMLLSLQGLAPVSGVGPMGRMGLCIYNAGTWYFPSGFLRQPRQVKALMLLADAPQYLHTYLLFSLPSYSAWFFPFGFLWQRQLVNALT